MQTKYFNELVSYPLFFWHSIRYQLYNNRYDWILKRQLLLQKYFPFVNDFTSFHSYSSFVNDPVHLQSECWHSRRNNKMLQHHARFLHRFHFVLLISVEVKIGVYMGWYSSTDSKVLGFPPSCLHFGIKDMDHSTIRINLKQRKWIVTVWMK